MIPRKSALEISNEIISALETEFNHTVPLLRGFNRKLAKTLGGTFVSLQKMSGSTLLCFHPATAPYKEISVLGQVINPLKMWGELVDIHHKTGQRAQRTIQIDVITQGGTLTSGELIRHADTQMVYQVIGDVALDAPTVTATIRATRIGILGNVDEDIVLYFENAPDDVEKAVTVWPGAALTGTDEETVDELRERICERFVARPQGGAMADFKLWAEEVEGVLNAYPYSGWFDKGIENVIGATTRAGQVWVYIEAASGADGIPTTSLLQEVEQHVESNEEGLASRRNINAVPYILPITRTTFSVEVQGLAAINITGARSAIVAGIADFMLKRQPGGQAGYTLVQPRKDIVSAMEVGGMAARIAASYGGTVSGAVIRVNGQVISDSGYYLQEGEKAKKGIVLWT